MADAVQRTRTTCPYCGVGCGVVIEQDASGDVRVTGDKEHPANFGRLCSKGSALAGTLHTDDRLVAPMVDGKTSDWNTALDRVAEGLRDTIATYGPESVALYGSGQLLTEDYYVANKFVKGWLGTANIDTNSRLCMASSVAGHKRAFGTDTVPGCYEDLETADLIVLVGSNLAWCHPVLYQRIQAARDARPSLQVVLIDPRRTATAAIADQHLALRPDTDLDLFAGLLADLVRESRIDQDYVDAHVSGFVDAVAAVESLDRADVARRTGLDVAELARFYDAFGATRRVVSVYSQGVNQSERGTDTVNAIIDCHLATGRIGHEGMGPFSVTGQPNAMGGREVGGLANMLAAHTDIEDTAARDRIQQFWKSPRIASESGPKAVDLFERVASGEIRAIWILATNPVDSMPSANRVREAILACPLVIVSDVIADTDTARLADVLLPSAAWSEKDGTVTNSERRISRQRGFRSPPGFARPDWWQIAEVAKRLGWGDAFDWPSAAAVFREHAALSAAAGSPDFDISGMQSLSDAMYDEIEPFQWPRSAQHKPLAQPIRFFANGQFHTPDGRARMRAVTLTAPVYKPETLVLNTGRIRDQWHTMTRTGRVSTLGSHLAEPYAEVSPMDAADLGIEPADIVEVTSAHATVRVRALITDRQPAGALFVPFHWTDQYASQARVDTLVSQRLDPISGQPALKSEPVSLKRWKARSFAYVVCASRPTFLPDRASHYWAIAPTTGGWRVELASLTPVDALLATCVQMLGPELELLSYSDSVAGVERRVCRDQGRITGVAHVSRGPVVAARQWTAALLEGPVADGAHRCLAGVPGADQPDAGATVCSCFGVGIETLRRAIHEEGCQDLASLGRVCAAGTNCGSCRPELQALLDERACEAAA